MGLLLEDKKPLERTPHFFGPGDGKCVNASGQLVQPRLVENRECAYKVHPQTVEDKAHIIARLSELSDF